MQSDSLRVAESATTNPEFNKTNETFSRGYRAWLLFVLMLVNLLNLADRQGLAAVVPALKVDLRLTDTQLGLILGLGFAIFYTLLGLPIARLAEHHNRARIVALSSAVFSAFVCLCSTSRSFAQILLYRVGVGAGDAGFGPPVASLLGDHYPERRRAAAMTIIWLGAPLGALSGSVIGGRMAQHGDWRLWFVALSVPALVVSLLAFFTLREPSRGLQDAVAPKGPPPSMRQVVRFILAKRSMVHVLIGAGLASIALNGIGQFWGRYYTSVFHLSLADSGRLIGTIAVVAMASGIALGGFGVSALSGHDRRWYVWAPAIALTLSTPLLLLGVTRVSIHEAIWLILFGHIALFVYYTPTLALAQNMVDASMRASASFLINVVFGLVGVGLGPTLIGVLSDAMAHRAFGFGSFEALCPGGKAVPGADALIANACAAASATGILRAIGVFSLFFLWAAVHFLLAGRRLERDLDQAYA